MGMKQKSTSILLTSTLVALGSIPWSPVSGSGQDQLWAGPAGWIRQIQELGLNIHVALFILGSAAVGLGLKSRPKTTLAILACLAWIVLTPEDATSWTHVVSSICGYEQ